MKIEENRFPITTWDRARRTPHIVSALVEGNSIRSTERITDTHRDTIMRVMVEVGTGCAQIFDEEKHDMPCKRVQVDEIWAYVGKKQRQVTETDDTNSGWRSMDIRGDRRRHEARQPPRQIINHPGVTRREPPFVRERMAAQLAVRNDSRALPGSTLAILTAFVGLIAERS